MKRVIILVIFSVCFSYAMETPTESPVKPSSHWSGKEYAKNSAIQLELALNVIKGNINLDEHKEILDCGCGPGTLAANLAQKYPDKRIVGLDASESMVDYAKQEYKMANLSFHRCDLTNFKVDATADLALCLSSLHWIRDQQKVLENIRGHLTTDGKLLISISGKGDDHPFRLTLRDILTDKRWKEKVSVKELKGECFPQHEKGVRALLKKAKFKPINVFEKSHVSKFKTEDDFKVWLKNWIVGFASIAKLMENEPSFLDDVIKYYKNHEKPNEDGSINYKVLAVVALAQKE